MNLEDQIKFYDAYWNDLKKFGNYKLMRISKIISYLVYAKKFNKNPRILDLGCGDGRSCAIWNEIGDTTGLDLSTAAMENARIRYPFIKFESGDATKTSFGDSSFDIIISQEVIEHIELQSKYIDECFRLLSDGGFLILSTPNKFYFENRKGGNYSNQPIEKILFPKELKDLLKGKFDILKFESIIHPNGDYGIYKILKNRWFNYFIGALRLKGIKNSLLSKFNLGLNLVLIAKKIDQK